MTDTPTTVRYHRAEYDATRTVGWRVWFWPTQQYPHEFTAAEGEAMGLTPPAPAPLVVTCNGHSVELSDEEAVVLVETWSYCEERDELDHDIRGKAKLARLLRDARQDPQPASDDDFDVVSNVQSVLDTWRVVYQPAPLSPGEHLRGLLAGRDDAGELWNEAKRWCPIGDWADARLGRVVGDAARSGGA